MKKVTGFIGMVLFIVIGIGNHANATEQITLGYTEIKHTDIEPAYLETDASKREVDGIAIQLSDEIYDNLGRAGIELLRSVNTRDGLIVLLRYFAENCEECKIAAQLTKDVLPTNVTNTFLSPERAISPTLDSRTRFPSDELGLTIDPIDLSCLNCIGVHCP